MEVLFIGDSSGDVSIFGINYLGRCRGVIEEL
jgi:hypothetical protein